MGWRDNHVGRSCHAVILAATREPVISEPESARLVRAARLEVRAPGIETMRQAEALDDRFGADYVCSAARQVVAAWAMAADGDNSALAAIAESRAAYWLMHPDQERWQVSPGPAVTRIQVWGLKPNGEPPRFRVYFEFIGRGQFADPTKVENPDGDPTFVGTAGLDPHGFGAMAPGFRPCRDARPVPPLRIHQLPRNNRAVPTAHRIISHACRGRRACARVLGSSPGSPSITNGSVPGRKPRCSERRRRPVTKL